MNANRYMRDSFKKLKDIGCDIEEWYREEGGKTDA